MRHRALRLGVLNLRPRGSLPAFTLLMCSPSADRLFVFVSVINASSSRPLTRRSSGACADGRRLERLLPIETCVGRVVKCERGLLGVLWGSWGLVLVVGAIALGCVGGWGVRLAAPFCPLTLALSRRAGEAAFIVGDVVVFGLVRSQPLPGQFVSGPYGILSLCGLVDELPVRFRGCGCLLIVVS